MIPKSSKSGPSIGQLGKLTPSTLMYADTDKSSTPWLTGRAFVAASADASEVPPQPFADFELTGEAHRNLRYWEWGISQRGHLIQMVSKNGGEVGAIPLRRKAPVLPRPVGALPTDRIHHDVALAPLPTNGHGFIFYRDPGDRGEKGIPHAPLYLQYSTAKGRFYNVVTGKPYRARPKKGYWFYV